MSARETQGNRLEIKQEQGKAGEHTRMQGRARKGKRKTKRNCFFIVSACFWLLTHASACTHCFALLLLPFFVSLQKRKERRNSNKNARQNNRKQRESLACLYFCLLSIAFPCFCLHHLFSIASASAYDLCFTLKERERRSSKGTQWQGEAMESTEQQKDSLLFHAFRCLSSLLLAFPAFLWKRRREWNAKQGGGRKGKHGKASRSRGEQLKAKKHKWD